MNRAFKIIGYILLSPLIPIWLLVRFLVPKEEGFSWKEFQQVAKENKERNNKCEK